MRARPSGRGFIVRGLMAAVAACSVALAALAAPASAGPGQRSILQDESRLVHSGDKVRSDTLDEIQGLGAEIVKVTVNWRDLAPGGTRKPAGFVGDNPAEYSDQAWEPFDDLVRGATQRGLKVMFLVGARAPEWAQFTFNHARGGSNAPNPVDFGRFVKAVGARYSGTYVASGNPGGGGGSGGGGGGGPPPPPPCPVPVPPGSPCPVPIPPSAVAAAYRGPGSPRARAADNAPLPRVSIWSVWNEPNLSGWLQPQYTTRRLPASPVVYRALYLAAHDSLGATGHAGDDILIGELLPCARGGKTYPARVSPLAFLRELACVDSRYKPYRGAAARARGCDKFSPLPGTGIAYHPYTLAGGPEAPTPLADDATINDLYRLDKTLGKLGRARRFVLHSMPIWLTEFGFQTNPPDPFASPIRLVPQYMSESEWLAFHDKRIKSYAQYPLRDDNVNGRGLDRFHGFQSGIRSSQGRPKQGVYLAYQTPLFVRLVSASKVEVFGGMRAAKGGETVVIKSKLGGGFQALPGGTVRLNPMGYFDKVLRVSGAARRQFQFSFGARTSFTARAVKRPRANAPTPIGTPKPPGKKAPKKKSRGR